MAERTLISEVVQLGAEGTLGTAVPANRKLPSLVLGTGVEAEFSEVNASGMKVPTAEVIGKEWVNSGIEGQPSYTELPYLLSSVLEKTTPVLTGTAAYEWTFTPSADEADAVQSYTIEQGSAVHAHRMTGCVVNEFTLSGDRSGVSMSGNFLGRIMEDDITLTAAPTVREQVMLFPKEFSVYVDTTSAGLGTTKLGRLFSWEWSIGNRFNPLWVVDADQDSWVTAVETMIDMNLSLTVEADDAGMSLLNAMREGQTRFIRIEAVSSREADAGTPYSFTLDMAGQINSAPGSFSDSDGVVAIQWNFKSVYDPTWDRFVSATVVNDVATI